MCVFVCVCTVTASTGRAQLAMVLYQRACWLVLLAAVMALSCGNVSDAAQPSRVGTSAADYAAKFDAITNKPSLAKLLGSVFARGCGDDPVDVLFAVDVSLSVTFAGLLDDVLSVVREVTDYLDIGQNAYHIAVLAYSTTVHTVLKLTETYDVATITAVLTSDAVECVPCSSSDASCQNAAPYCQNFRAQGRRTGSQPAIDPRWRHGTDHTFGFGCDKTDGGNCVLPLSCAIRSPTRATGFDDGTVCRRAGCSRGGCLNTGVTNYITALKKLMYAMAYTHVAGARTGLAKLAFFVTDGRAPSFYQSTSEVYADAGAALKACELAADPELDASNWVVNPASKYPRMLRDEMNASLASSISTEDACYLMLLRQARAEYTREAWKRPYSLCKNGECATVVLLVAAKPTRTQELVAQELGDFTMAFSNYDMLRTLGIPRLVSVLKFTSFVEEVSCNRTGSKPTTAKTSTTVTTVATVTTVTTATVKPSATVASAVTAASPATVTTVTTAQTTLARTSGLVTLEWLPMLALPQATTTTSTQQPPVCACKSNTATMCVLRDGEDHPWWLHVIYWLIIILVCLFFRWLNEVGCCKPSAKGRYTLSPEDSMTTEQYVLEPPLRAELQGLDLPFLPYIPVMRAVNVFKGLPKTPAAKPPAAQLVPVLQVMYDPDTEETIFHETPQGQLASFARASEVDLDAYIGLVTVASEVDLDDYVGFVEGVTKEARHLPDGTAMQALVVPGASDIPEDDRFSDAASNSSLDLDGKSPTVNSSGGGSKRRRRKKKASKLLGGGAMRALAAPGAVGVPEGDEASDSFVDLNENVVTPSHLPPPHRKASAITQPVPPSPTKPFAKLGVESSLPVNIDDSMDDSSDETSSDETTSDETSSDETSSDNAVEENANSLAGQDTERRMADNKTQTASSTSWVEDDYFAIDYVVPETTHEIEKENPYALAKRLSASAGSTNGAGKEAMSALPALPGPPQSRSKHSLEV